MLNKLVFIFYTTVIKPGLRKGKLETQDDYLNRTKERLDKMGGGYLFFEERKVQTPTLKERNRHDWEYEHI